MSKNSLQFNISRSSFFIPQVDNPFGFFELFLIHVLVDLSHCPLVLADVILVCRFLLDFLLDERLIILFNHVPDGVEFFVFARFRDPPIGSGFLIGGSLFDGSFEITREGLKFKKILLISK